MDTVVAATPLSRSREAGKEARMVPNILPRTLGDDVYLRDAGGFFYPARATTA